MSATTSRPAAHPASPAPEQHLPEQHLPEEPTIGALVHDLSEQIPDLVRSEIKLAQAEVTEKGKRLGIGIGMFGAGGYLAHLAAFTLVAAAVLGLAEVVPGWAAALIVAGALLAIAGVAALVGRRQVARGTPPVPERAIEGIGEDLETLKGARP